MDSTKYITNVNNTNRITDCRSGTHLYICDGTACDRNCAEAGYDMCHHTTSEKHAKTKCRRERKFVNKDGLYLEV